MGRGSVLLPAILLLAVLLAMNTSTNMSVAVEGRSWCIARSGSSSTSLQTSLDYACASGADCSPIQASGLCYLPNTMQAHASYAFNSYYQRSNYAPGSCDFAGTATITISDPSYGSCTYPATPSSAGGSMTPPSTNTPGVVTTAPITNPPGDVPVTVPTNTPTNGTTSPIFGSDGGGGASGLQPGFGSSTTNTLGTHHIILLPMFISSCWFLSFFI